MINGKVIGTFLQPEGLADEEILVSLKADEQFASKLGNLKVKRIIYKPGKVFNILT